METNFNFKSANCTSREQSERLLTLGLKKETADMCWQTITLHGQTITYPSQDVWLNGSIITKNHFPAWSLHRLMCLVFNSGATHVELFDDEDAYEVLIYSIEWRIKEGYFNKNYLV